MDAVSIAYKSTGGSSGGGITVEQAKKITFVEYDTPDATNALTADDLFKQHKATVACTFTLPPSAGLSAGDWLEVEKDTSDTVTVEGEGTDEIEYMGAAGAASLTDATDFAQSLLRLVWDGTVWRATGEGNWT